MCFDERRIFNDLLKKWFYENNRNLPWRKSQNVYYTWLSEIIFQQTRINQGLPYYKNFISVFPNVKTLAESDLEWVLKNWQGLGYYSRAINLHKASKIIHFDLKGEFPASYNQWLNIPGVGKYTAALISSVIYKEPVPALDGNIKRICSRLFEINEPILSQKFFKLSFEKLKNLIDKENPGNFNEALMDLGSSVCIPKNPTCSKCPLKTLCKAYKNLTQDQFPIKSIKKNVTDKYFQYFIIQNGHSLLMKKRDDNYIWKNFYDFPLLESDFPFNENQSNQFLETSFYDVSQPQLIYNVSHKLTHLLLHISFYRISGKVNAKNISPYQFYTIPEIELLPLPKPIEKFLNYFKKIYL